MKQRQEIMLTVADLEFMPEDDNRYEVIDGDLYVSTAPSYFHQYCLGELFGKLYNFLKEHPAGHVMFGVGIIFDEFNGVIPDLVYFSNERKKTIGGARLTGAPEIVVEVLSPGQKNEQRDRKVKRRLYSENGVSEYWIMDPEARSIEIHKASKTGGFRSKVVLHEGDRLTTALLAGFQTEVGPLFEKG